MHQTSKSLDPELVRASLLCSRLSVQAQEQPVEQRSVRSVRLGSVSL